MVEEYDEIADSQYPSERLEFLEEDYGKLLTCSQSAYFSLSIFNSLQMYYFNWTNKSWWKH